MYYTGIDLHKKTSYITTVDEMGRIVAKANLVNHEDTIIKYFKELKEKTKIVIESMSSWYWLYDLLIENGFEVVISNPLKTKAISSAKIKNDKLDSHMLAQLLRPGLIATVRVSSLETRCAFSKGFGQKGHGTKRWFCLPYTLTQSFTQVSNHNSACAAIALFSS